MSYKPVLNTCKKWIVYCAHPEDTVMILMSFTIFNVKGYG